MKQNELIMNVEKEDILSEILKKNVSKRFYRFLKYSKAEVLVNGEPLEWFKKVSKGAEIKVIYITPDKEIDWPKAEKYPRVVLETDHYLIVDKEPNLLTIPTRGNPNSLYQQLVAYLGEQEIHILNRLDKETSGLVVVAKDRYAASLLEPTHKHMTRKYLCLVEGKVETSGTIENYIAKEENSNKRYVSEEGKLAISHYRSIEARKEESLLEFVLATGRTHQIRVHTSHMGHPIIGDKLYGGKENSVLCLTSYSVEFIDPFTNERIHCTIEKEW
ncbi:MAG: RluA family pseudouridine synthase [Anaeroplasmataceae bacterium]|nr:RluA family pseudouridine synthase [Anaeroplasmataceae bacterium]MDE6414406.1 RluA family pseudouridine synthase [Anaeroplasmataceae bacterium]